MIDRWSFSRLQVYESCPKRAQLAYDERLPEIKRPDGNKAAKRGNRLHEAGEDFIKGKTDVLIPELMNFEEEFRHAQNIPEGSYSSEQVWYFDDQWVPVATAQNAWVTLIIDLLVWIHEYEGVVIDFKSGKRYGNEIKHGQQVQLYQLCTFLRYPETEKVTTEIWYLDKNELYKQSYMRKQGLRFLNNFHTRGMKLTTDSKFKANPSQYSCRFCPYRTGMNKWVCGTGDCNLNPPDSTEETEIEWKKMLKKLQ